MNSLEELELGIIPSPTTTSSQLELHLGMPIACSEVAKKGGVWLTVTSCTNVHHRAVLRSALRPSSGWALEELKRVAIMRRSRHYRPISAHSRVSSYD